MCTLAHGEKPSPESEARHLCGKGHEACVAPAHLTWGTPAENAADRILHGTAPQGERHWQAKLDEASARFIALKCSMVKTRGVQARLAKEFNVSTSVISGIAKGKRWQHLAASY